MTPVPRHFRRPRLFRAALPFAAALLAAAPLRAAETVLTPTRVIYPGEPLGQDSVEPVTLKRPIRDAGAVATDLAAVEGKVARRTLVPGKLIPVSALREPWAVEAGRPVEAVFAKGGLSISLSATALQSGAAGDFVRLRNADSGKTFSGTVMPDGTVRVGP